MYDIVFLSRIIPEDIKPKIVSKRKNTMSDSSENLQWKIIKGLDHNMDTPVKLYNIMPIQSYPKYYDDIYVSGGSFSHTDGSEDKNFPFFNLMYVKRFFMGNALYKGIKKWAKTEDENEKIIISYSLIPEFTKAIKIAKKYNPNIKVCAVVADLPEYTVLTKKIGVFTKIYLNWMKKNTNSQLEKIDYFTLLTEQMSEKLVTHQKYIVMEGICTDNKFETPKGSEKKIILYAGTLNERFGVMHLVNAFMKTTDKDMTLVLCGLGDAENKIKEAAKVDKRIDFRGQLSGNEIMSLMSKSTVIVNPRNGNEEFTKYSFPSKNLEALSSGVPFIAYKLAGIPDDYDEYINYPHDLSAESLCELITNICNDNDCSYKKKALEAQKWVFESKNCYVQANRILSLIGGENDT